MMYICITKKNTMQTINGTQSNGIANRKSIAEFFGTDELTTHRILQNLCYGFFISHFGSDADAKWEDAHPFTYPNNTAKDYTSISLDFIAKHFELFARKQFVTGSGWQHNEKTNRMEYTYTTGYVDVA